MAIIYHCWRKEAHTHRHTLLKMSRKKRTEKTGREKGVKTINDTDICCCSCWNNCLL